MSRWERKRVKVRLSHALLPQREKNRWCPASLYPCWVVDPIIPEVGIGLVGKYIYRAYPEARTTKRRQRERPEGEAKDRSSYAKIKNLCYSIRLLLNYVLCRSRHTKIRQSKKRSSSLSVKPPLHGSSSRHSRSPLPSSRCSLYSLVNGGASLLHS